MKRLNLVLGIGLCVTSGAAEAQVKWMEVTPGAEPGKPAEFKLDSALSDDQRTVLDLVVHGFWLEEGTGPDGAVYQKVSFPGLGSVGQVGAPDLPAATARLAVVTGAPGAQLVEAKAVKQATFDDLLVWPHQPVGLEGEEPPPFAKDVQIYSGDTPWPSADGVDTSPANPAYGVFETASCDAWPVKWNPKSRSLTVGANVRYTWLHAGAADPAVSLTKDKAALGASILDNWPEVDEWFAPDVFHYEGRYLFVTPDQWLPALQPLIDQKKQHGFEVTVFVNGFSSSTNLRIAIGNWYQQGPASADHYCLLVGDEHVIPQGTGKPYTDAIPSDDPYGSPLDGDLDEEIFVGRLSADDAADVTSQVQKILAYQEAPVVAGPYQKALLIGADAFVSGTGPLVQKYHHAQDAVAAAAAGHAVPPAFQKAYFGAGGNAAKADVANAVDAGLGLVAFRGGGGVDTWWVCNSCGGFEPNQWHDGDVAALSNTAMHPVVWSFGCCTSMLDYSTGSPGFGAGDSIAEFWMQEPGVGAVAHYGSGHGATTVIDLGGGSTDYTLTTNSLEQFLVYAVYDLGLTVHGAAIAQAEAMLAFVPYSLSEPYAYHLLGDPAMKIRRGPPVHYAIGVGGVPAVSAGQSELDFSVHLPSGQPADGVLISLWKPSGVPGLPEDEVFVNAYTQEDGAVSFLVHPKSGGVIHYAVRDDEGNVLHGELPVQSCTKPAGDEVFGTGKPGTHGTPKLTAVDPPVLGAKTAIRLTNGLPGALPVLILGVSKASLPFDGGTLLATPDLVLALPTPIAADGTFEVGSVVPADPKLCGLSLVHQILFEDEGASGFHGLAMTNGLLRVFGS